MLELCRDLSCFRTSQPIIMLDKQVTKGEIMRLDKLIDRFLDAQTHRLSPNTLKSYRYDLELFARFQPDAQAQEITVQALRTFLNQHSDAAPSTLARRKASLSALFSWAYQNDLIGANPTDKLERIRVAQREPRPLSAEQVVAILSSIPHEHKRNRLLFTLLVETGMRVGEALNIHPHDVHLNDRDGGYIRVIGKGDHERIVPLIDAPLTVRLLREFTKAKRQGPLFRGDIHKGGHPGEALDYTTAHHHFSQYVKDAQASWPELFINEDEPITIHRLRHTYATEKLRSGVSLPSVRKLLGHKNIQTMLRYAETDLEDVKRELVEARRRKS
jgi:integrase/recombinase XerD